MTKQNENDARLELIRKILLRSVIVDVDAFPGEEEPHEWHVYLISPWHGSLFVDTFDPDVHVGDSLRQWVS